ncbi:histidine kinase dimerization/phosphoacceptor domain-containing protein [Saccharothrix xinjiangensis]|uniref:histidine kinase n=1 Tax=Saccharothrix xinjiangensis TaxID=204798 RepID=A0ABV9Y400_9PSEU
MWRRPPGDPGTRFGPRATPALVALLFALDLGVLARGALPDDWPWWARLLTAAALAAGQSAPVLWWRRRSVPVWAALLVACGAAHAVEVGIGASTGSLFTPGQWAVLVALHGVGLTGRPVAAAATAGVTVAAALVVEVTRPEMVVLAVASAVLLGRSRAARAEVARALAVREERTRVARELHDVVAHHMSVLAVQAETAPYRLDGLGPEAAEEFREVAEKARQALNEMRDLLGALRGGRRPSAHRSRRSTRWTPWWSPSAGSAPRWSWSSTTACGDWSRCARCRSTASCRRA